MQTGPSNEHALIRSLYEAYNACDLRRLLTFMSPEVDWPDGETRLHGLQAVEDYWSRLWACAHIHDQVISIFDVRQASTTVRISQVVRDLAGKIVSTGAFEHSYTFRNGLVVRMDLRELQSSDREKTMNDQSALVRSLYAAFNQRDIPSAVALMDEEVDWANGQDGGHVHGRDAVCAYWTKQWAAIQPQVEPLEITPRGGDVTAVEVHQVVHDLYGKLLLDERIRHVFRIRDHLVVRFDIENAGGLKTLVHD